MSRLYLKLICAIIFFLFYSATTAQQKVNVFHEVKSAGFIIYASNTMACPVSVILDLKLENLSFSKHDDKIFVVPENTTRFKIGELNVVKKSAPYRFSFHFRSAYGNILQTSYDPDYEYWLPYKKGNSFLLIQGYNGLFSHLHENALDFLMPEGTEITAAREGTVMMVVQNNTESCLRPECKQWANYILVYHSDNTFAEYGHIKLNGAKVKAGDKIKKGDIIALSGNTGYSSVPHLHFACYTLTDSQIRQSIKTKFKTDDSTQTQYLKEKIQYLRSY